MTDGPRYEGLIFGFWGNRDQKLGDRISQKGAKNVPQKLYTTSSDSIFNVDYGFVIKHCLTQRFDQVTGVQS